MHSINMDQRKLYTEIDTDPEQSNTAILLAKAAAAFGFKAGTLLFMPARTDTRISPLIVETTLISSFFEELDAVHHLKECAVYENLRVTILPVFWSTEQAIRQAELIRTTRPASVDIFIRHGLSDSMLFPMASLDGSRHFIRYDGDRGLPSQREINDLCMLSMHIFQAFDRVRYRMAHNPCGLTERELEIVQWTATGKTSSEIGTIIGLSDHTVNAYLNNALRKLDCVNRVQLVAKAIRMRIIN